MASSIVTLGYEDVVVKPTLKRLVKGYGWPEELLLDLSQPVEAGLQLEMVITGALGNGRDYSNKVAFRTNIMC